MDASLQFLTEEFGGGGTIEALDANRSGHLSYLDCPQYSYKQFMVSL
jgi:hypothetical protein